MLNMQDNMEFGPKEDSVPLRKRKCTSNKKNQAKRPSKKTAVQKENERMNRELLEAIEKENEPPLANSTLITSPLFSPPLPPSPQPSFTNTPPHQPSPILFNSPPPAITIPQPNVDTSELKTILQGFEKVLIYWL